jgi:hypothetical protein
MAQRRSAPSRRRLERKQSTPERLPSEQQHGALARLPSDLQGLAMSFGDPRPWLGLSKTHTALARRVAQETCPASQRPDYAAERKQYVCPRDPFHAPIPAPPWNAPCCLPEVLRTVDDFRWLLRAVLAWAQAASVAPTFDVEVAAGEGKWPAGGQYRLHRRPSPAPEAWTLRPAGVLSKATTSVLSTDEVAALLADWIRARRLSSLVLRTRPHPVVLRALDDGLVAPAPPDRERTADYTQFRMQQAASRVPDAVIIQELLHDLTNRRLNRRDLAPDARFVQLVAGSAPDAFIADAKALHRDYLAEFLAAPVATEAAWRADVD